MNRFSLQIHGESGMGLESMGEILMACLKNLGLYVVSEREYPSLIKGGHACVYITVADQLVRSIDRVCDLGIGLGREGLDHVSNSVKSGGTVLLACDRWERADPDFAQKLAEKNISFDTIDSGAILELLGIGALFANMLVLARLVQMLGLDRVHFQSQVSQKFGKKPVALQSNLACIQHVFLQSPDYFIELPVGNANPEHLLIDGNTALALGAIHAGVRAYYAYPMSPSSSILSYLARVAPSTGMIIKQAEDEITAVQMTLGSNHMGTRALTATSGGGFDLMTETVSLAGMIETPLTIILAQRPGPATGLPTWTAQGDLNLAIYSGHGEFARLVVSVSDPGDAFLLIQYALNLAEIVQIPVIVLTEKTIAERKMTVPQFEQNTISIVRGLISTDSIASQKHARYVLTDTGISPRWFPGTPGGAFFANGDEHDERGNIDESENTANIAQKRIKKAEYLLSLLPDPEIYGNVSNADHIIIGFGSTKNAVLDAQSLAKITVAYIHFSYLFPLKTEIFSQLDPAKCSIVESNQTGQFAQLIFSQAGWKPRHHYLQTNGRSLEYTDVLVFLTSIATITKPQKIQL